MWRPSLQLVVLAVLGGLHAAPQDAAGSLVTPPSASTTTFAPSTSHSSVTSAGPVKAPKVYALNVRTDIRSRYARTLVSSRVANPADRAQEVTFQVTIPESAFISKFVMEVEGELMEGVVRERVQAKQEYHHAVQQGQTAGHVATASVRDASHVRISVNVAAQAKASFNLTYEELLVRTKGRYELAINLSPGQPVNQMSVDVYIQETRNISRLQVPAFRSSNEIDFEDSAAENKEAEITWVSGHQAHVHFAPTEQAQRELAKVAGAEERGLSGQFIVRYDVDRPLGAGEVLALDGYFVHFFSPPELTPLPKHVVFVLDVSGSMHGRKMEQLREAMDAILGELREGDFFNLVEFSYSVTVMDLESPANSTVLQPTEGRPTRWYPAQTGDDPEPGKAAAELPPQVKAFPASSEFIAKAREAVRKMSAGGGTNIHDAVRASLGVVSRATSYDGSVAKLPEPLIIFLTDGEATVGETRPDRILALIKDQDQREAQDQEVPIFSLAFGQDADLSFLKRLSLRAGAFARKIYEAADAALQLRDFYRQVASPLLANVTFNYMDTQVDDSSVTKQKFSLLFSGSELVVAGKLRDRNVQSEALQLNGEVHGESSNGSTSYLLRPAISDLLPLPGLETPVGTPSPQPGDRFLERLWAYLSIRQLLERYDAEREDDTRAPPQDGATPTAAPSAAQAVKAKALELALRFSFVTPVTSLVVVHSNDSTVVTSPRPSASGTTASGILTTTRAPPVALQFGGSNGPDQFESADQYLSLSAPSPAMMHRPMASFGTSNRGPGGSHGGASYQSFGGGYVGQSGIAGPPAPPPRPVRPQAPQPVPVALAAEDYDTFDSSPLAAEEEKTTIQQLNLTLVDATALTWLEVDAAASPANNEWSSVTIANNTYKLLNANHTAKDSEYASCAPPLPLVGNWSCRPLLDCALAEFASSVQSYFSQFKCSIGSDEFLGSCCPEQRATPPVPSESSQTTDSTIQPQPESTSSAPSQPSEAPEEALTSATAVSAAGTQAAAAPEATPAASAA